MTNLRIIWVNKRARRTNISVGLGNITSLSVLPANSRLKGQANSSAGVGAVQHEDVPGSSCRHAPDVSMFQGASQTQQPPQPTTAGCSSRDGASKLLLLLPVAPAGNCSALYVLTRLNQQRFEVRSARRQQRISAAAAPAA
jgi:hypothetical protein